MSTLGNIRIIQIDKRRRKRTSTKTIVSRKNIFIDGEFRTKSNIFFIGLCLFDIKMSSSQNSCCSPFILIFLEFGMACVSSVVHLKDCQNISVCQNKFVIYLIRDGKVSDEKMWKVNNFMELKAFGNAIYLSFDLYGTKKIAEMKTI